VNGGNSNEIDVLLADLASRDIRLFTRDGALAFNAPKGALTSALKERISALRDALISRLSQPVVSPLSGGQARMWFINRLNRGSGDYTEHLVYEYAGPLDRMVLERALTMVAARHGAIRARFRDGADGPEMVVPPPAPVTLHTVEIAADALDAALSAAARRPIDLATDEHVRFTLLVVPPDRRLLSVSAHHAAWDGWSNGVFARDLEAAYDAALRGGTGLPPLRRDVTERRPAPDPTEAVERRRRALADFPTALRLPVDRPRPTPFDMSGAAVTVDIPAPVGRALTEAGRSVGATPTMVILAAWGLRLARIAGVSRLLIGVPTAGRRDGDEEAMIGYLSETAVVPIDIEGCADFADLVARVRDATLTATTDAEVPFERLVDALVQNRSRDTTPLTQILFSMQPATVAAPTLGGIKGRAVPHHNEAARAELTLNLEPTAEGGWTGPLTYATSLFDRRTVERWMSDFTALLARLPSEWREPLDRAPARADDFATEVERRLAALWGEFLRTAPTSRNDDFFMLGGHSLMLMRLVHKINESGLGHIDLADAMEASTVAAMAARLAGGAETPAPVEDADEIHPASGAQEGIWLSRRDDPASVTWMTSQMIRLGRRVTADVATRALTQLVARHPATRAALFERDGAVLERVAPPGPVVPTVHEGLDRAARAKATREELRRPFGPDDRSLHRFHLFRNSPDLDEDAVFVAADHTMTDGWSQGVLSRDLIALVARAAGDAGAPSLPPLRATPAEIAARRAAALAGERGRTLSKFWAKTLDGMELGDFPAARSVSPGARRVGRRLAVEFPRSAIEALDQIAHASGVTETVAAATTAAALVARMKGDGRDVAIATPFAVRAAADEAEVVAGLAEALPLRLSGDLSRSFADLLAATRDALRAATAHQDYPLRRIIEDRTRALDGEVRPIFDMVVVVEEAETEIADWFDPVFGAGKYDFAAIFSRRGDGSAVLTVEYDALAHDEAEARAAVSRLTELLIDAARRPETPIGDLNLFDEDERRALTERFSAPDHPVDRPPNVSTFAMWEASVRLHADRTAMIATDGRRVTYAELNARAERIARALTTAGVAGPVVATATERGVDAVAAILAVWRIGAAYLPIDVKWPVALLSRLLSDAGATAILTDAASAAKLDAPAGTTVVRLDGPASAPAPVRVVDGDAAAYVMFTSGTTGTPKGVIVPHRGIGRLAFDPALFRLTPDDVGIQTAPLAFDATTIEIWPLLLNGGSLRVLSDEEMLDPKALAAAISEVGCTFVWLTCGLFNRVLDEAPEAFARARVALTGGETMSVVHARRFLERHPDVRLLNAYGPTENACFTTTHVVATVDLDGAIPIGRPVVGTRVFIVDDRLRPAPIGCWGELVCAGDGVALGYAGRPDLTAKSFVELPWGDHARVYRTGDRARFRFDGVIEFGERRDGQVKIRGHRIEAGAIEATLTAQAGVRDAAVLVVGEGVDRNLVAVVAADESRETEWRKKLSEVLPLHMMPAQFAVTGALPVNANGKRDRRALLALIEAAGRTNRGATGEPPQNAAEALTLRLFAELFPTAVIDRGSDFFRLGGHSLLAMRLSNRLEAETGCRVPLRELFAARTVAGIAGLLATAPAPSTTIAPAVVVAAGDFPLSPGQERLWVIQRLFPDTGAYNVPMILDISGPLDEAALGRALTALEERHHALRLRVFDTEKGPRQRLQAPGELKPVVVDLSSSPDPRREALRRQAVETARPFKLERENGARAVLTRLGPDRHRLLLMLHHSICDGWSIGPLFGDLGALYARETGNAASAPLPPTLSFEDVATERRAFAGSVEGRKLVDRWIARLNPPAEPLNLPTDRPRPPVLSFRGAIAEHRFSKELSAKLLSLGRSEGATPFALGSALVTAFLARLSGQTDIAVGTLVSGRARPDLTGVVGFLVNTLVLRRDLAGDPTFRRHLAATRDECMRVIADQDCSFETVVDALNIKRAPGRNPLFDVMIVWQDTESAPPAFPGAVTRVVEPEFPFAKFDLSFDLGLEDDRLICRLEYASDLFDAETIDAFQERLEALATFVVDHPDAPINDLPILSDAERTRVVETFNATTRALDTRRTIPRPFLDRLATDGERIAVLRDDSAPVSHLAFARLAGRVARRLIEAGAKPGDSIALVGPRSLDLLAAIHGTLMAGCAYVPLGADQPAARVASMLDDLGHPLVLAAPECRASVERVVPRVLDLSDGGSADPVDLGTPDGLAYVLFTSGSTGKPKGVAIEHHAVLNRILWMAETFPIGPGDVILQKTAVTFDVSVWELFWWSWVGAAVALPPPGMERDPHAMIDFIERHGVTVLHFVPSMLTEFLSCLEARPDAARRLARLRYVFASGEALDPALVARFDRLLHRPFGVQLHNLYGPTEATVDVTWFPCSPWNGADVVPIGKPIANTQVRILDERGRVLPIGVPGEIHLGGPQVARGYVARPELTAERFIPDPFRAGGKLYRTGDLGRWRRDGNVEYLGRIDNQVKIRGQRIEPGEIERALEAHPAIERAFVVPALVAGLAELRAFVVVRAPVTSAELRTHLRARVTDAMIPARFLRATNPPLTSSGKTDRKALTGEPLDAPVAIKPAAAPIERDEEAEILAIWKTILPPDADPGPRDGFFDAGGNSLLVIRLHEKLDARWPGAFAVPDLFALSTVSDQARRVRERTGRGKAQATVPATVSVPPVLPARPVHVSDHAVAIVGLAVRLPGAETVDEMWRDVVAGVDRVRHLPPDRIADANTLSNALGRAAPRRFREAAYLDEPMAFDPRRFRMSPADAALLDPEQRLFLDTASRALEDAGRGGSALDRARVGVFVGGAPSHVWREAVTTAFPERLEQAFALNVPSNIATRLSFLHDWRGPAMLIDTACSSALAATHQAARALRSGECDWALAGAAKVIPVPPDADVRVTIDSSTGRTRAFAEGADGTGMGEGSLVFLLRPLDKALADGDPIHAVILGSAVNQDGASSGPTAPNPAAQAEVIRAAASDAGVPLSSLSLVEAHGTGTALGDPIEIEGLTRAFAPETSEVGFALVVSGKGNYGHLDGAAGALGLARAALALAHDLAPPQPFFHVPNPRIAFDRAPVRVPATATPLADRGTPRRAGVSSFGLSGINAHIVLERAPDFVRVDRPIGWVAVVLSAPDAGELRRLAGEIVAAMRADPATPLADVARTLNTGREMFDTRVALWVRDRGDLMARLAVFAVAPEAARDLVVTGIADRRGAERSVPLVHADENAAREAATALVAGASGAWPEGIPAGRVRLPAARPARRRLFPDFPKATIVAVERRPASPSVARHIGAARTRDGGRVHTIDLHAVDFWPCVEHKLNGSATLVGAAFPALIAETTPGAIRLTGLRWARPLRPAELRRDTGELSFATDGAVTLSAVDSSGRRAVFAAARTESAPPAPDMVFDIDAALRRLGPATVVPPPSGGLVEVSGRWNRMLRATGNEEETLAWFSSPDDGETLRLHPALLDAMIGTALTEPGHVPSGCAEILLWGGVPADPVVHARRRRVPTGIDADIRVIDPATGRVAMALNGFRLTRIGGGEIGEDITLTVPRWEPAPAVKGDPGGPAVVIGEGPIADRLADRLAALGRLAARRGEVDDEIARLIGATDGLAVILAPEPGPDAGLLAACAARAINGALRFPTLLLGLGTGGVVVDGQGPIHPEQALVKGVLSCAGQEEPLLSARYVDTDDATSPDDLLAELGSFDDNFATIAWRNGRRLVRRFRAATPGAHPGRLPSSGVIVVSGGLGGFALALAPALTRGVSIALLSRDPRLPDGGSDELQRRREALDALRATGARVEIFACDVSDRVALAATLGRIRVSMGRITGVVHHAASTRGSLLVSEPADMVEFNRSLAPKVTGARLLDELTRDDPVEMFLCAGSLTGLLGSPGHTAYTGANAFLDALAFERVARGAPALTVDWCGLRGMGMAARLTGGKDMGVMIDAEEARALLLRALATGEPQVVVLEPISRAALGEASVSAATPVPASAPSPGKATGGGSTRALEAGLAVIWAETLGYDTVGPDDDFYELGGDSIAGMRIVERVVRDLGRPAKLVDLMETGTVAKLAARLAARVAVASAEDPNALRPAPEAERYPVAWEQHAVLKAEESADMGTAYNLPVGVGLSETIEEGRLRANVDELFRRHEILRTRFHRGVGDEQPTMEVLRDPAPDIETLELSREEELSAALAAWVRPFDLWNGKPPVRVVIARVAGRARALVIDVHHALADALSMEILLNELTELHADAAPPAPKLHLKDYAWWSRKGPGSRDDGEARAYWLDRFKGAAPKLDLPSDRPRPPTHTWRVDVVEFALPSDLVERTRARASAARTTPFALVTLVWSLLLSRYARTDELVIAVPVDARTGAEMARMPGMLVSLLPLRLTTRTGEAVGEAIRRVHTLYGDAMRHRSFGLGRLIADLAPATSPDRATLSEVTFSYMNFAQGGDGRDPTEGFSGISPMRREGKSDLGLYARDLPDAIIMAVEYYADMFDRDRIERMARHFQTLLAALLAASEETPVASLSLIDDEERKRLALWGAGHDATGPIDRSLFDLFLDRATATPDAPALDLGAERLSYRDLADRALRAAGALRDAGIRAGDRVALRLERDPWDVVWTLATAAIGATYVPLDPDWPDERNARILGDAGVRVVVVGDGRPVPPGLAAVPLASVGTALDPAGVSRTAPAYIMYTSGSTGTPKGVIVPQRGVARLAFSGGDIAIRPDDVILRTGSPAFDAATLEIWGTLLNGARLVVASAEEVLDPAALANAMRASGATVMWLTSGLFHRQVDEAPDSFAPLRLVITGGDVVGPSHARRVLTTCPNTVVVNGYGPTENTTFTTVHEITRADTDPGPIPIGRPIARTRVVIAEPSGERAPIGVWGEIHAGGDGLALGYLNRADLTQAAFILDPDHPDERLYRTGDLGRFRADGVIEFGGRFDDQIKVRGFRVELGEIERALGEHPNVRAAAALFIRDGASGGAIVACLETMGTPPAVAELRELAARRLPAHAVPRRFVFVPALPISSTGKVDRRRLLQELPPDTGDGETPSEPPRDEAERLVARVFSEVFERPVDDRNADFLALGGHSLSAIRVVNRIAEATGTRIAMRDFLAGPTVARVAALIKTARSGAGAIPRVPDRPSYPAGHAQTRLYLAHRMDEAGASAFNISAALGAGRDLDIDAFREALARLARRHESLRTSFIEEDGRIQQRIAPSVEVPLLIDDVSTAPDPNAECLRLIRREAGTSFDLKLAPLFRGRAIWTGASGWIVLLVLHHIVGDGWSIRVLFGELGAFYDDAKAGRPSVRAAPPIAYRDYTAWAVDRDWTAAAENRRAALAGAPDHIELPTDHPPSAAPSHRGDTAARPLPPEVAAGLSEYARSRGVNPSAVGLALFAGLLNRLTRQNDLVIGMGVAGRDRVEVEGLIGFFVNVLPIRIQLDDQTEFATLVDRTSDAIMGALDHRDYPFDLLVRDLAPKRTGARQPLINVVFEYQRFDEVGGGDADAVFGPEAARILDPTLSAALGDALRTPTAKHDLLLFMIERGDGTTTFELEFDTDLIDRTTAETWLVYLERFARAVVGNASGSGKA